MVLLDSGNFSDNPTPAGDVKTKGLLQAMGRLGYSVVNVGDRDIRMGYPDFAARTAGLPFTFVSANIVDRVTQRPIFKPHAIVEMPAAEGGGVLRVGVVGAVRFNPVFLKAGPDGGNIVIVHPLDRVRAEVEALRAQHVHVVVLLAALHKNDAVALAREVPGIDFVFGSYGGLVTTTEERHGDATLLYCGNRGQRLGETRVFLKEGAIAGAQSKLHTLTRHYPADQAMLDFVNTVPREPVPSEAAGEVEGGP
jgi:2',3'-cyclic-nucleotide 2'-phosphodiesterase (5'-nucleotidase family)